MKRFAFSLVVVILITPNFILGQRYTEATKVHTYIQTSTKNGVAINGSSNEMKIEYPQNGHEMQIYLDPLTISTDNLEFNEQMQESLLGPFEIKAEVDVSRFEYQSRYNEVLESQAQATINDITRNVIITLVVTNKKTINTNTYVITGTGVIDVEAHKLHDVFPNIADEIKFEFTQSLSATLR